MGGGGGLQRDAARKKIKSLRLKNYNYKKAITCVEAHLGSVDS